MAKYYNKTRGPVTVTLFDGRAMVIRPKKWSEDVPLELEGSSSLAQLMRKGVLVRERVPVAKEEPVVSVAKKSAKREADIAQIEVVEVEKSEEVEEKPISSKKKKRKTKTSKEEGPKTSSRRR